MWDESRTVNLSGQANWIAGNQGNIHANWPTASLQSGFVTVRIELEGKAIMQQLFRVYPVIIGWLIFCPVSSGDDNTPHHVAQNNSTPAGLRSVSHASDDGGIVFREDIVYGRIHGAALLADIAYPKASPDGKVRIPAIISVHGGRWQGGHKQDSSAIDVKKWAQRGFFAMSIDYRLVGCSPVPACYQDLQCAIRYLHAHAKQYRVDSGLIFLIGQSAGGHMASLAATIGDGPFPRTGGWEDASNQVKAVISVAANYDLPSLSWGDIWTPAKGNSIEAQKQASPVVHVHEQMTPILVIHSDDDQSVPIQNALLMVDALKKANAPHRFVRYSDAGHMGITDEVTKQAMKYIQQQSREINSSHKK